MMVVRLLEISAPSQTYRVGMKSTHKRQSAVSARIDLWLVHIDEDPRMSQWSPSPITRYNSLICPPDRLLVNQFNRGIWPRLPYRHISLRPCCADLYFHSPQRPQLAPSHIHIHHRPHPHRSVIWNRRTWNSIIVCSNLGPLIATSLGCWLLLHTSFRFGACSCRLLSASSGISCKSLSHIARVDTGTALVSETLGTGVWGRALTGTRSVWTGSLAE